MQSCSSNTILLTEEQHLWIAGHSQTDKRDSNVAPRQWLSRGCRYGTRSCLPAKLDTCDGGNNSSALQSQKQRLDSFWLESILDPTLCWDNGQDKRSSGCPECRQPFWLNNLYRPAWEDGQLTVLGTRPRGPTANSTLPNDSVPLTVPQWQGKVTAEAVSRLCEKGQLPEAVDALRVLVQTKSRVSISLLYRVLKTCVAQKNLVLGRRIHDLIVKIGYESNAFLGNHILRMYAGQGRLQEAVDVFTRVGKPDAFMWFSMISAHAEYGEAKQAVQLYLEMRRSSVKMNSYVFVAALQACANAVDLKSGRQVHADLLESGVPPNLFVCNCLVGMYAKCGNLEDARRVFDSMDTRDVVTWTVMIAGYAEHGLGHEALALYARMEQEGTILADHVMFACLVKACANAGALQRGKQLHSQILERGMLEGNIVVGNCLVEMYAKCGRLEDARRALNSLPIKDAVTWTAMINGYGQSHEGNKAIDCFHEMLQNGVQPDRATFTCLLVACSHEGLVNEGRQYFNAMVEQHGFMPTVEHYTCMVDLLGRAGHLDEAENMLLSFDSNDVGWMSLLNSCKSHGDIQRGARCFESLVRLDPRNASAYVLMANMYADAGRWIDVDRIERLRKSLGASKKSAMAGIEVNRDVRIFVVGEEKDGILSKVQSMHMRLKEEAGHLPHTELVLKQLSEKEKEDDLCGHAEKLALAYGLLNTPDGTPLLVTKNLRMCRDCHRSTEIMSRIEKREIVVRDAHRVHRFVGGSCGCGGRP